MPPSMLARAKCCLIWISCLATVSGFYAPMGALNTHALVLCDTLDADVAHLLGQTAPEYPSALAESRCVAINVCDEQNHRGEGVARGAWLHRGANALELDGEALAIASAAAADEYYNYYSLQYARVPEGVLLEACEPDFDRVRTHGEYVCAGAPVQVSGACPGAVLPVSTELVSCLAPLQPAAGNRSDTLDDVSVTVPTADARGSTQMVRYALVDGWGCFDAADAAPGTTLTRAATPNRVVDCPVLENGAYTDQCAFSCDAGYAADGTACVHVCGAATAPSCANGHYANTTCDAVSPPTYVCELCAREPGRRILPWSAANAGQCVYEDCPTGTFEQDSVCEPCPPHTYTDSAAQTACVACARGTFTSGGVFTSEGLFTEGTGKSVCSTCFDGQYGGPGYSGAGPECADGEVVVRDLTAITAYFNGSVAVHVGDFDLYAACVADVACLPCAPGSSGSGGACEPCAVGTYQPNFKQTVCFACGTGFTTHSVGRALASECVCLEGFE